MKQHRQWIPSFFLVLLLLGLLANPAAAQQAQDEPDNPEDPTAVGLVFFTGEVSPSDEVVLSWRTASELNTQGFKIERSTESDTGPFEYLEAIGIIFAEGGPQSGSDYEAIDTQVEIGETYWYQLVEIDSSNTEIPLETVEVFVEPPPVIPTTGNSGTNTPAPTSTDIPTNTPIPSETPTVTPTPTIDPESLTPSAEPEEPTLTPTNTVTPRPAGPSPTPFVFPTATQAGAAAPGGSVDIAEAAGPPGQQGYPASGNTPTPFANVTVPAAQPQNNGALQNPTPYPASGNDALNGNGADNPRPGSGGAGDISGTEDDTTAAVETEAETGTSTSRIVLWLGLAGGLLILVGGIFFSISLATRRA